MLSIILSCVTEVRYVMVEGGGGGSVIAAVFLAHNYFLKANSSVITSNTVSLCRGVKQYSVRQEIQLDIM